VDVLVFSIALIYLLDQYQVISLFPLTTKDKLTPADRRSNIVMETTTIELGTLCNIRHLLAVSEAGHLSDVR